MTGAIAGDIIGSVFEAFPHKSEDFPLFQPQSRFTDDTVLTVAVADCILNDKDYASTLRQYGRRYPDAGYGGTFINWIHGIIDGPYNSWGNGSAMRVSPVGFAFDDLEEVLWQAERSAAITHNHPEGIKGAQAVAAAVWLARQGSGKKELRNYIGQKFGYDLHRSIEEIRPAYRFDVSCQGSVPEAIIAFLDSGSYEEAVRKAISLGGDADTQACIAGAIAQAFYGGIPERIEAEVKERLTLDLLKVVKAFEEEFLD
jgi:ADP-ribosylglycohydrolase